MSNGSKPPGGWDEEKPEEKKSEKPQPDQGQEKQPEPRE